MAAPEWWPDLLRELATERAFHPDRPLSVTVEGLFAFAAECFESAARADVAFERGYELGLARGQKDAPPVTVRVIRNSNGDVMSLVRMPDGDGNGMQSLPVARNGAGG